MVSLHLPNEDFGWSDERFKALFRFKFIPTKRRFWKEEQKPCGKQHFREIPTPDFVRTLRPYPILNSMLDSNIYLQNPAWVFRGNVVSHMEQKMKCGFPNDFHGILARIEYSHPWKVLPSKSGFHLLFLLPKSSFGRDKFRNTFQGCESHSETLFGLLAWRCAFPTHTVTSLCSPQQRFGKE